MTAKKATVGSVEAVPASIGQIENTITTIENDPATAAILNEAASKIPAKYRQVIYIGGIVLGGVVSAAATVAAALTGNAADVVGSVGGLAYSLSNLLAVLHLNVPASS